MDFLYFVLDLEQIVIWKWFYNCIDNNTSHSAVSLKFTSTTSEV